jgi:hypothetical protein
MGKEDESNRRVANVNLWLRADLPLELAIAEVLQQGVQNPELVEKQLMKLNQEIRDILFFGGAVTSDGQVFIVNLKPYAFESQLSAKLETNGVLKCTNGEASKIMGTILGSEIPLKSPSYVMLLSPGLDGRLSCLTKGLSPRTRIDGKTFINGEYFDGQFKPLEEYLKLNMPQVESDEPLSLSAFSFLNLILHAVCRENGNRV